MKKQITITAFLMVMCMFSFSQTITPLVIASDGDFYTSAPGSISWTLGELSTESYSVTSNYLTQGFQQPTLLLGTGLPNKTIGNSEIIVYPNPVSDNLTISFKSGDAIYTIDVYDSSGKKVHSERQNSNAMNSASNISFENFENGIYLVNINENGNLSRSFRISKIN